MDSFSCACGLCYDTMVSEQPACLSEPFGEDESYFPFLLRLFEGGEGGQYEQPACLSEPFGEDESYLPFLLRLFEGGEGGQDEQPACLSEPFGEDESYLPFLLRLFEGDEGGQDEHPACLSEPFGEDESYLLFLLRLFEGGEGGQDEQPACLSEPFGEDESYLPFLLRLFEGGEGGQDEDVLAPARVNEIEEEADVEASDGNHQSQTLSNTDENDDDQHIRQGTIEDFHSPARLFCNKHVWLYTIAASITSFSLAFVQAGMSGAAAAYRKMDLKVSDDHLNVLMGGLSAITLLGLATARWSSDRCGRRKTIMVAGALYFVGPLFMGFSRSYSVFLVGRICATFGAGFASMIGPMYVTEISPLFSRGFFGSFPQMFTSVGIQVANLSTYYFSKQRPDRGWRWMLVVGAVPSAVVLVFGVFALPESPQWLIMRGRLRDAKRILAKTSNSEEEAALRFADIKKAAGIPEECDDDVYTNAGQNTGIWRDIIHPTWSTGHMLLCAVGIQVVQQACGMDTLALFSPKVFESVHITTAIGKLVANVVIDAVKIVIFLLASSLTDRVGRRPLLLTSMGGVFLSLVCIGLFLTLKISRAVQVWAIIYVVFFSIGLGPITDVYCTEIIPLRLRAQAYIIGLGFKQGVNVALSWTYLLMFKAITVGGAAFLFGGIAVVGCLLFYFLMPETRAKTLDEIGQLFGRIRIGRIRIGRIRRTAANDLEMQRTEAAVSSE